MNDYNLLIQQNPYIADGLDKNTSTADTMEALQAEITECLTGKSKAQEQLNGINEAASDSSDSSSTDMASELQSQLDIEQNALASYSSAVSSASGSVSQASSAVSAAANTLNSTPQMLPAVVDEDGKMQEPQPNPAYYAALNAYQQAQAQLIQAQAELENAQAQLQEANETVQSLVDEIAAIQEEQEEEDSEETAELEDVIENFNNQIESLQAQIAEIQEQANAAQQQAQNQKTPLNLPENYSFNYENGSIGYSLYNEDGSIKEQKQQEIKTSTTVINEDGSVTRYNPDGTMSVVKTEYGEDGKSTITNVTTEQSDNIQEEEQEPKTIPLIQEEYTDYATRLYEATSGQLGTDETKFYEILNDENLTGEDWANIIQSYGTTYNRNMIDDIDADFSGLTENGVRNEIMSKITSKLLQSIEEGSEFTLDVACRELYSSLNFATVDDGMEAPDVNKADEFATNLLQGNDKAISMIYNRYSEVTGSNVIDDINNNDSISKANKDLFVHKFQLAEQYNLLEYSENSQFFTELNTDDYALEDANKAWSVNLLIQNMNDSLKDLQEQNNEDGSITGNFNTIKAMTGLGISSEDIIMSLEQQEQMINELTDALNGKSELSFEEVYKNWTGVEYDEEKIIEYQENANNYQVAYNALCTAQNFQDTIQNIDNLDTVLDLYIDYFGDEEKGRAEFLSYLQEGMLGENAQNEEEIDGRIAQYGGYVSEITFNEEGQLVITKITNYNTRRSPDEEYQYETIEYDLSETPNIIKTMPRYFDDSKYIEQANQNLDIIFGNYRTEETDKTTFEILSENYANSKKAALGTADKLEETVNKYCQSQDGFIDKLASISQGAGMTTMVIGGVTSFFNPPAGAAIMSVGKYMSLGGMFGDNILQTIDGTTSANGLSKEEMLEILKETATEISYLAIGSQINSLAEAAQTGSLEALQALGLSQKSSTVLSWLVEGGTDLSLSVLSDIVISGDTNFDSNSLQVLMGILTGVAAAKTNSYKAKIQEEQLQKLDSGEVTLDEVETTLKGAGFSNKEMAEFREKCSIADSLKRTLGLSSSTSNKGIDYSNIVTTREEFKVFNNGSKIESNTEVKVASGTVVEIGRTNVNLDDLNIQPGETKIIGRTKGDIVFSNDKTISGQHLQVTATQSGYIIKDLNSTNGTKIAFSPLVLTHRDGTTTIHKNISNETHSKLFKNCYSNSSQQSNGDCYLLSAINALYENPYGRNAILNCFQETPDGRLTVSLPNGRYTFDMNNVMKEVRKNPYEYSETDPGIQALEYAFGIEKFDKLSLRQKAQLARKNIDEISFRAGGLTKEVMQMFGLNTRETNINSMVKYLSNPKNWQNKDVVFNIGTRNKYPSEGGHPKFLNEDMDLVKNHMYMARPKLDKSGRVVVELINPWHSNRVSCTLTLDQIASTGYFDYFSITKVK